MITACSVKFSRCSVVRAELKRQMSAFEVWFLFKLAPVLAGKSFWDAGMCRLGGIHVLLLYCTPQISW